MKKILFILFILISCAINAQKSTIEITNFSYEVEGDERVCGSNIVLTAVFDDGSEEFFAHRKGKERKGTHTYNYDNILIEYSGRKLKSLKVFADVTEKRASCNGSRNSYLKFDPEIKLESNSCFNNTINYTNRNEGEFEVRHDVRFDYKISTSVDVTSSSGSLGYEDAKTIEADPSFSDDSYNWQYQIVNNTTAMPNPNLWTNITRPATPSSLEFVASDILTANPPEWYFNKYIYFRIKPCYDNQSPGSTRFYKILPSAPHITAIENNTGLRCNGTDDAEITLVFDKNLEPGESFALEVLDLSVETGTNENGEPLYAKITIDPKFDNITADDIINDRLTITGLPGSTDDGFRIEFLGGTTLFADGDNHKIEFNVYEPEFVQFTLSDPTDVNCNGGQDGTVLITAEGGTDSNYQYQLTRPDGTVEDWVNFDNTFTHTVSDLSAGLNKIKVRDGNECVAKELVPDEDGNDTPDHDNDLTLEQLIEEPANVLDLEFLPVTVDRLNDSNDATANGFTDGRIIAVVTGGTAPYNVVWTNKNTGIEVTTVSNSTYDADEESQTFTLNNIGEGTYTLTVTDANHTQATQKTTCFAEGEFSIEDPDELLLTIEETNPVSCNSTNEFNNPVGDGQLVAHGTGGIKLDAFANNGLPYYYTWKKEDENGVFQELTEEKDSIISNLTAARYAVNIRDANGIVIGNYVNNSLVNETDVIHDLLNPEPFVITFNKGDLLCSDGTEGWAEASITGGTGSYTLNWSNGSTESRIENLEKGTYLLFVTDEKGCQATSQVIIDAPNPLQVAILEENDPVCNNGSDGVISLGISGGLEDYTYNWLKDGDVISSQTGFYANNLTAGTYTITVSDANLCSETVEITLENPNPDLISLGEDRLLCGGQSVVLDATYQGNGTTYLWTSDNGFTSTEPSIEVAEAGTYTVEVTTLLGCSGGDSIIITTSDTPIDAHFIVSTQAFAGEELALVNISEPIGDKVEWFLPEEAVVIAKTDENVILLFDEPGSYEILLRSNQGTCFLDYMKTIIIGEAENIPDIGDAVIPFIQEFKIYPNPSSGEFYVDILLSEASSISLKIFSMASQGLVHERKEKAAVNFNLEYGTTLASGTYVLLLETAKGSEIRKIIIK
ncbi:T9SS type A sorting domain-containing protein [Cellulophaga fucicola]|uniref:Por secretion system C-terminal sorting domain-containing protein n=1 Tax=Cellulophaga fucicola TaxID=76595 RepID=A0A1K1MP81_9FLAO|nr:T9SS type A sorting domain-containing protein [Cellulophaga fucicola]SFW24861.1 Por secretion system C-terminal sorting domain-containing protein [Cellulophaga fucicola]